MGKVWTDAAIRSQDQDELGRAPYAMRAAELIAANHTWDDSIVYGLTGPWGSGKTSMLAMVEEELEKDAKWRVARFTPWASSDVAGLLAEFYASLGATLPPKRGKDVRAALGTLAEVAAPAMSLIPVAGGALAKAAELSGAALNRQVPWDQAFGKAASELKKLNKRVLVVADDIDRLQTDELLALLKVVRLLGRFPGVHYLLAYDEGTLFNALGQANLVSDVGAAQRFIEKIVQYPLVVPAMTSRQLLDRLQAGLKDVLGADQRGQAPPDSRISDLDEVFVSVLSTPRAVDRFLAQLRHHLPLVADQDIHTDDVIVLTLLRTAYPTVHAQLPRWRKELTSGHTGELADPAEDFKAVPFDINPLVEQLPAPWRPDAAQLLRDLFPDLPTPGPRFTIRPRPRGVSDERYFYRYFTMSVPEHDVSDIEIAGVVTAAEAGNGEELIERLNDTDHERANLALDKARAFTAALAENDSLRLALLRLLTPQLNTLPETGELFTSLRRSALRWVVELLQQLSYDVPPDEITTILDTAPTLSTRAELIYRASRDITELPAWFPPAATNVGNEVATALIEHIEQGDNAPIDDQVGWLVTVLTALEQGPVTRPLIAAGLADGRFTLADVAARFVMVDLSSDPDEHRVLEMRRDEFEALVPPIEDGWYQQPQVSVEVSDVGWVNRKAVAAGRFARPNPH